VRLLAHDGDEEMDVVVSLGRCEDDACNVEGIEVTSCLNVLTVQTFDGPRDVNTSMGP